MSIHWNDTTKKYEFAERKTPIDDAADIDKKFKLLLLNEMVNINKTLKEISIYVDNSPDGARKKSLLRNGSIADSSEKEEVK